VRRACFGFIDKAQLLLAPTSWMLIARFLLGGWKYEYDKEVLPVSTHQQGK
jgi:hypothetical protein